VKKNLLTEDAIAKVFSNVSYVVKFHTLEEFVTWLFEKRPENNGRASTKAHFK
jgi:hypothetical protein